MKIAVCDDTQSDREQVSEYIRQYASRSTLDIEIDMFANAENLLLSINKSVYKIIFLDILLGRISGIEAAFKIREIDKECVIIFITTSPDYRAEGFEVGATHYLIKPVSFEKVEEALNRCRHTLLQSEKHFEIIMDRHPVCVHIKDILYIEVYDKKVLIHTTYNTLNAYMPLAKIEKLLTDSPFIKCHRCYIVNMQYIKRVCEDSFQLINGDIIPIHRKGRQDIKNTYSRYFFNYIRGNKYG